MNEGYKKCSLFNGPREFALCNISQKRLEKEKQAAKEKYGKLAYRDYYNRFVSPLISQYIRIFKKNTKPGYISSSFSCKMDTLPAVTFRDPDVDAQIAVYVLKSFEFCYLDPLKRKNQV